VPAQGAALKGGSGMFMRVDRIVMGVGLLGFI